MTADMRHAVETVDRCAPNLPPHVLAAFSDAAFNLGGAAVCDIRISTMARYLRAGRIDDACKELPKWSKARVGGVLVTLPGLLKRRQKEMELCLVPSGLGGSEQVISFQSSRQPLFNRFPFNPRHGSDLTHREISARSLHAVIVGPIHSLRGHGDPSAIAGAVVPVVVGAIKSEPVSIRFAHVRKEPFESFPIRANRDAAPAVPRVVRVARTAASSPHIYPRSIELGLVQAVARYRHEPTLLANASAIGGAPAAQLRAVDWPLGSTLTPAHPHLHSAGASPSESQHGPFAESVSDWRFNVLHS
jgi:hypothetical protein